MLQALQALYHHPDQAVTQDASNWLEGFQHNIEAWQIADSLLYEESSSLEVQYFCAQTLRTKVQRDFEELPGAATVPLRDSLMALLLRFSSGPPAVRTQLCLALAALAVHAPSSEWGSGEGAVKWLAGQLGPRPGEDLGRAAGGSVRALLEVLAVLPQEGTSFKLAVRPERRRQFMAELDASVLDVLNFLAACLGADPAASLLREQVLGAFATWLRCSYGLPAATLAAHPLTKVALDSLDSPDVFDVAVEAVCELIRFTKDGSSGLLAVNMPLVQLLVPKVIALRPRFSAAVKAATAARRHQNDSSADVEEEEDEDVTKAMARLFAEMGEAYVELIAGGGEGLVLAEVLAEVTAHPDHGIATMTFNFWHSLSDLLTGRTQQESAAPGSSVSDAQRDARLQLFRPLFEHLVSMVSFRVLYPPDNLQWRRDERADFKQTRHAVTDVLADAANVLGGEHTLSLLSKPLFEMAARAAAEGSWANWRLAEGSLYCIRGIADNVPRNESVLLPQIMMLLPKLPQEPLLLYTAALVIAAYCDWLASASVAVSLLPALLSLLMLALAAQEDAPPAAALALKHLCDACRRHLVGSVDPLLSVYRQVLASGAPPHLEPEDELQLVEGLSFVVSALPPDQVRQALDALCQPIVAPLQQLLVSAAQASQGHQPSSKEYILHIDRIANIFRYVSQPQPLADAFQELWPTLKAVFDQRGGDIKVMERLCRACKYAIRSCGEAMSPVLGPLLQEVQLKYQQQRHSCLLYVASEVVKTFGRDASCGPPLSSLLATLFEQTVSLLKGIKEFTKHPDVADDCFLLASRCMRYCPQLLVPFPVFLQLLDCALVGITVQHREACKSVLTFLFDTLELPRLDTGQPYRPIIEPAMLARGPACLRVLVAAAAGALPESRLGEVEDVLGALLKLCGQQAIAWASEAIASLPATAMSNQEKETFLQSIAAVAAGSEGPRLAVALEEISGACRRNKWVMESVLVTLQT